MSSPKGFLLQATQVLLAATSRTTGEDFFRGMARGIAQALGVKYGLVGALGADGESIKTCAVWADGEFRDNFVYALEGTPCQEVLTTGTCFVPAKVQARYPRDTMLIDLGIDSYLGIPVRTTQDRAIGLLIALHDEATDHPVEELAAVLPLFAERAAAEIDRVEVERKLRASETRFRNIVTSAHEGVWALDEAGATTFVNQQMASILGFTPEEMMGRHLFDFMDSGARLQAERNLGRRAAGIAERHEFRLRRKDGSDAWVIMSAGPLLGDDGRNEGALAMVSDLTETRALEAKIQHAQKLESLGALAGGIAHDFNNLLVGVLGNSGLALRSIRPESPIRPMIEDIQSAALRASELTRQMLAYSGRGRFVIEPLRVNQLVEEIGDLLSSVVSKRAVLRYQLADDLPRVDADASQLRQVVVNLVVNASEALLGKDGIITISSGTIEADRLYLSRTYLDEQLNEGTYVFIEVADTGCGMDAATMERLFDPFFTTKFTGRGLGLAAVLGIVRGHRGAVKVYSEPGKGSTFKVLLPASAAILGKDAEPGERASHASGTGTVLVADDEGLVRRAACKVLEDAGFDVLEAGDGAAAVEVFAANKDRIVAVLLDMTMPRMAGDEVFRRLRLLVPSVRVILTSGYSEEDATARFVGKGLAGFLRKPWMPDELLAAISASLDDHSSDH